MCAMSVDQMLDKHSYSHQQPPRKRDYPYDWKFQNLQTGLSGPDNPALQEFVLANKVQQSVQGPDICKNPGRILRSPRISICQQYADSQMSARIIGIIRAG